jgi:hypothetical protein
MRFNLIRAGYFLRAKTENRTLTGAKARAVYWIEQS